MENRINLEKRGRKPSEITEFVLDNCRSTTITGLTDEFVALESLSLNNVGLTSLKGFPKLPNLKKLELGDNRISSGLNLLSTSPKLTNLNLSGNKIKDLDTLQPLKDFHNLQVLDLYGNEATNIENYREKVFNLIPSLQCLDGFDIDECEIDSGGEDDEVNGNDESNPEVNEDDSDDLSDEEDDEDLDDGGTLEDVYKDLVDESDEEDYVVENEEDDDDEFDEDDEEQEDQQQQQQETSPARGKKRKHEDGVESEN